MYGWCGLTRWGKGHPAAEGCGDIGNSVAVVDYCEQVGVTCLSAAWQVGVTEALEQRNPGRVFARVAYCGAYLLERCAAK